MRGKSVQQACLVCSRRWGMARQELRTCVGGVDERELDEQAVANTESNSAVNRFKLRRHDRQAEVE